MRVYLAGPIFTHAERAWLDRLAHRVRDGGLECFAPHEHLGEAADTTPAAVYRLDSGALRDSGALLAWLDGPIVDDGTAAEIGAFAELVHADPARYRGIVGLVTDLRLERRRGRALGDGINLFLAGAIEASGKICWSTDEAIAALHALSQTGTLPDS
jgi:nucleoside 2-deoxyribosyltransferase